MRGSKAKLLTSIARSTIKKASKNSPASRSAEQDFEVLENLALNHTTSIEGEHSKEPSASKVSSIFRSKKSALKIQRESTPLSSTLQKIKQPKSESERHQSTPLSSTLQKIKQPKSESERHLYHSIADILGGSRDGNLAQCNMPASDDPSDGESQEESLEVPWLSNRINSRAAERQKLILRGKKEKWVFKNAQGRRFQQLFTTCDEILGTNATLSVLGKLGRENGMKEYRSLIAMCVEKAKECQEEEEDPLDHIHKAYQLIWSMNEQGFQVNDEIYGPLLLYLVDMRMVEEFHFFIEVLQVRNCGMHPRLGYYEMLLWIKVDNDDKVQELCNSILLDADADSDGGVRRNVFDLAENYLLAFCESDRKKELLQLLEIVDITKLSSPDHMLRLFKSMGRLLLEEIAEKLILALRISEVEDDDVSNFICNYAISMPNFAVEDVISKFRNLHEKLDVRPSSVSFKMLIMFCCRSHKVHAAFALVEQMCELDMDLPVETLYPILNEVEESCELALVHPIYSVIRLKKLKPNNQALRTLIDLCVKIKDFESAYNVISDLKEMDTKPTAGMYNAILAGYLREKKIHCGENVVKQMKLANVQLDSRTFSYLIANSECEEDIVKYLEEMQSSNVQVTKHVYMSLINAYVKCGLFEKAKQVILDPGLPVKNLNEVKSVLVAAFASCGQISDALKFYDEIKQAGCCLEPKAVISLIEHLQSEGELSILLELLEELKDPDYWFDGCERVIKYCIRYKHLSSAVDLLKKLKDQDEMSTYAVLDQVFCQLFEIDNMDLQIGLDLLEAVKEELKLCPSRTSLDFLLSSCVIAKDQVHAGLVWEEYQKAGLSYNIMSYLRLYQVHMACGSRDKATEVLKKIPKDDLHVRSIIKACEVAYSNSESKKKKKKKKKSSESKEKVGPYDFLKDLID